MTVNVHNISPIALNQATSNFLKIIESKTDKKCKELWQIIFEKCATSYQENRITSCVNANELYTLTFSKPLRVWIESNKHAGGAILLLGVNKIQSDYVLTCKFSNNEMHLTGAQFYIKTPLIAKALTNESYIVTEFKQISIKNNIVKIQGTWAKFNRSNKNQYTDIVSNWKRSEVLEDKQSRRQMIESHLKKKIV